jgi:hypothetical protein
MPDHDVVILGAGGGGYTFSVGPEGQNGNPGRWGSKHGRNRSLS